MIARIPASALVSASLSAQPNPTAAETPQAEPEASETESEQPVASDGPVTLPGVGDSDDSESEPNDEPAEQPSDPSGNWTSWNWPTISAIVQGGATLAIALFTFFLVRYNRRLLVASETAARAAKDGALAARVSTNAARRNAKAAKASADAALMAERAWISLDTLALQGFGPRDGSDTPMRDTDRARTTRIVAGLRNPGGTPAMITGGKIGLLIAHERPDLPPYDSLIWSRQIPSTLMAKETTNWRHDDSTIVRPSDYNAVRCFTERERPRFLWVFGFVEYKDVFGASHAYSFARQYDGSVDHKPIGKRFRHVHDERWSHVE